MYVAFVYLNRMISLGDDRFTAGLSKSMGDTTIDRSMQRDMTGYNNVCAAAPRLPQHLQPFLQLQHLLQLQQQFLRMLLSILKKLQAKKFKQLN